MQRFEAFGLSDYIVFAIFILVYFFVGIFYNYKQNVKQTKNQVLAKNEFTNEAYFHGLRQFSLWPVTASIMVSFLSAVTLLGTNAEGYRFGLQFIIMTIAYAFGFILTGILYVPVFYNLEIKSAYQYIELRFGRILRIAVCIVHFIEMFIYLAVALYAPALALGQVLQINFGSTIALCGILATIYTAIGGIKAVIVTDLIQSIVMWTGFVSITIYIVIQVGGLRTVMEISENGHHIASSFDLSFNIFKRHTVWNLIIGGTFFILNLNATSQSHIQRYVSCKTLKIAQLSAILNFPLNTIFLCFQLLLSLVTFAYYYGCDPLLSGSIKHYNELLTNLVMESCQGTYIIRGIFMSCLFAAALSTISSGVNSLALICINDLIPQKFTNRLDSYFDRCQRYRFCSKIKFSFHSAQLISLFIGFGCTCLAFLAKYVSSHVLQLAMSILGAFGGPIFAIVSIGISMPFVNNIGGICGFISSLIVGVSLTVLSLFKTEKNLDVAKLVATSNCTAPNRIFYSEILDLNDRSLEGYPSLSNISYLHYTTACYITGVFISSIVSALTGLNKTTPVDEELMSPIFVWGYTKLGFYQPPKRVIRKDLDKEIDKD